MLVNLSNHSFSQWSQEQLKAAQDRYGAVIDLPFPIVKPQATLEDVQSLADNMVEKCFSELRAAKEGMSAVHVMGEFVLTYRIIRKLESLGIPCVAATTERIVHDNPDGTKTHSFRFEGFRSYF